MYVYIVMHVHVHVHVHVDVHVHACMYMSCCFLQEGQLERLKTLITRLPSSVNVRCLISGDTPLISAAREGHMDVVELLLKHGADVTVQNDADETALDVCSEEMRKVILGI